MSVRNINSNMDSNPVPTVLCTPQQADKIYNGLWHVMGCTSDATSIGSTINGANYGVPVPVSCFIQAKTIMHDHKCFFADNKEALDDITTALETIKDVLNTKNKNKNNNQTMN